MSANHAPRLSQPIHASTPDPAEAEKASLREQLVAASAGLVAEAKCVPDDWEDMQEEKTIWLRCWEEKMVVLMPLVEQGKMLGVSMQVDAEDAPALAEANDLYEQWTMEEAEACTKAEQDVQMGEEAVVELGDDGTTVTESDDEEQPKAVKASPSKQTNGDDDDDDDDDIVEVVETHGHGKGKVPVHGGVSGKAVTELLQALGMVRAKVVAAHAVNLHLQVHIKQLAEALAEHGIE
ncbi:hypothetical protein M404DRAFT_22047 [Pisolithus tinctorius Marx 270]|uniref:Uncharacterized protein n=1 Tax=Pisolithus tinctorius Marx 270 TaxID=870435 RepID=A0A0C3PLE6_PISTI|nr:hypothetical protein M404DRAFT_22047 [Pisolithus tinctorius Marx 270]